MAEIKLLKVPNAIVVDIAVCICILFGKKAQKNDYWGPFKKLSSDSLQFKKDLINYDKDNMSHQIVEKLYARVKKMDFEKVKMSMKGALPIVIWLNALADYG